MSTIQSQTLQNGLKILGESFCPGASLLLDGKIKSGVLHAGGGFLAKLALGVPGLVLVAANSYSQSVTGKNLVDNFFGKSSPSTLQDIVKQELASGKTAEEIKAGLAEDVDDICEQA